MKIFKDPAPALSGPNTSTISGLKPVPPKVDVEVAAAKSALPSLGVCLPLPGWKPFHFSPSSLSLKGFLPSISLPSFSIKIPSITLPSLPSISIPKIGLPGFSCGLPSGLPTLSAAPVEPFAAAAAGAAAAGKNAVGNALNKVKGGVNRTQTIKIPAPSSTKLPTAPAVVTTVPTKPPTLMI
jgi:hypothetical protein